MHGDFKTNVAIYEKRSYSKFSMNDEIKIHDDSNKPVRTAFAVTSARVQHYDDIVEYMVQAEVARCKEQEKFTPSHDQIEFLRKELIRYMVIRRDVATAQTLKIRKSNILNETSHRMGPRA